MSDPVPPVDVSGRALELRVVDWDRLLRPRTVAVVGATDTVGTQQRAQWLQVHERLTAEGADVIPVHPTKPSILGTPAVARLRDIGKPIDVAIVLVRDPLPVLTECVELAVGFAVVFSAGFAEVRTPEGDAAERRLRELAAGPTRVIGPNTNLNIYEPWPQGRPGRPLGIITQSGYQGRPITQGQVLGIGIDRWATLGNEGDIEWADMVGYFAGQGRVGAIASFVEGFRDGRSFQLAADAAARAGLPIVLIKVGRSDAGREMALAHTGHLTGSDAVHDAVFEQYGVIRVDDLDELIEISGLFCHAPIPESDGGVGIYAMSGGTASHVADLCGAAGLPVPRFADKTVDALGELVPWFLERRNPLDSGGVVTARPENRCILELILDDPNIAVLFAPITGVFPGMSDALARDLIALHEGQGKPVVASWNSPQRDDAAYRALCEAGVPVFHSFGAAVRGIKALLEHTSFVRAYRSPFDAVHRRASPARARVRPLLAEPGPRNEVESKELLRHYGIPVIDEVVATSAADAVAAARRLGLPVALKLLSRQIAHKSDLGLVRLGLATDAAVRSACRELLARAATTAPSVTVDGVVVQAMAPAPVAEMILGLSHQPPFGPTITVGMGGVLAEVYADVAFAVPPFGKDHARRLVDQLHGAALLYGARGRPAADVSAVVDAVMRLQRLAVEVGDDLVELDINPLMVLGRGDGVVAVDALAVARGR